MITLALLWLSIGVLTTAQQFAVGKMSRTLPSMITRHMYLGKYTAGANVGAGIFYCLLSAIATAVAAGIGWLLADVAWAFALYTLILINLYWAKELTDDLLCLHKYDKLFKE